jgi:hypothetical protein
MQESDSDHPVARIVAVVAVGFAAGWATRQVRKRLGLPVWTAPVVGIVISAAMHRALDAPVTHVLARTR